jgi:hypothetical protein
MRLEYTLTRFFMIFWMSLIGFLMIFIVCWMTCGIFALFRFRKSFFMRWVFRIRVSVKLIFGKFAFMRFVYVMWVFRIWAFRIWVFRIRVFIVFLCERLLFRIVKIVFKSLIIFFR